MKGLQGMKLDLLYPSSNMYDIPDLDPTMQAGPGVALPVRAWGSAKRKIRSAVTWHFYVDDYRFGALWSKPHAVLDTACFAAVEPNPSIFDQTPFAMAVHAIYRKRWLARHWQACGLRTFVDLNVPMRYQELNLCGVPRGWSAYATRGYCRDAPYLMSEYEIACEHARGVPLFVVVGGGRKTAELIRDLPGAVAIEYVASKNVYSQEVAHV